MAWNLPLAQPIARQAARKQRDQLEKHGVYLDAKENKWHSTDGRSGNSVRGPVMSHLSDDEVAKILAARQAARLRHDFKTADRLRDQLPGLAALPSAKSVASVSAATVAPAASTARGTHFPHGLGEHRNWRTLASVTAKQLSVMVRDAARTMDS